MPRSHGRAISPLHGRRERSHSSSAAPHIALSLAESVGHLQQSIDAPRNPTGTGRVVTKQKPPSPLRRDSTSSEQTEQTRWNTPPRGIQLPLNYLDKLKMLEEREAEKKREPERGSLTEKNINRIHSSPEKGGDGKQLGLSRLSPVGIDTLRRVVVRNSAERVGGSLERRGSSSSNVTTVYAKVVIGKDSADRLQRLSPTIYIRLISQAIFPYQLVYLSLLTDDQYGRVISVFTEKLYPKLRQMNNEQFRKLYHTLKSNLARKRFKELLDKQEFQKFSLLIDGDEILRRKLREEIINTHSDNEIVVLVNQRAKSILNSHALIKEVLDLYKISKGDPRVLYNLVSFAEHYVPLCTNQEVMQVSSELSDLVNFATNCQINPTSVLEKDYESKIKEKGLSLKRSVNTISEEFFAQEIIDLILHRKEYALTTFDTLCEHFALSHVWFTNTPLLIKKISENLKKDIVEDSKPLLQFLDTLIKKAPPEYFTEAELTIIRLHVTAAESDPSENVKQLAESLKSNLERKNDKTISKSESDPTPSTLPGKGSKIGSIATFESLLKKNKSKVSAELLACDLGMLIGSVFRKISLGDLTRVKWKKNQSPTINAYETLYKQLTCFFQCYILDSKMDNKKRAKFIKILIETLRVASASDYATSMLIVSVLNSAPIKRLSCWEKVDVARKTFLNSFDKWVEPGSATLKKLMDSKGKDSINPFIIPILAEFITVDETIGNICSFTGDITAMINETKVKNIAELLKKVRGYQQRLSLGNGFYKTELNALIKGFKILSDDEQWAMSQAIDPSKSQNDKKQ